MIYVIITTYCILSYIFYWLWCIYLIKIFLNWNYHREPARSFFFFAPLTIWLIIIVSSLDIADKYEFNPFVLILDKLFGKD